MVKGKGDNGKGKRKLIDTPLPSQCSTPHDI